VVPFNPDAEWGVKAVHHGIAPLTAGSQVPVELSPKGPQRDDLADDIAAALDGNTAAGAFFDTLAQFYRKGYLRYIDATKQRPDLRAQIVEMTGLLASGIKERPRSWQNCLPSTLPPPGLVPQCDLL
jgi:uncharacterized protein YdeI (YjbR/CyaY-like superfamily)